jgi:uncharacterized protein with FMN-binding domain
MSSNTKIVVLRSKELVYAVVIIVLSILIILVALSLFSPDDDSQPEAEETGAFASISTYDVENISDTALYTPGIYSGLVSLGNATMELSITVDYDHINSISISNLDETIETLYPLMSPTLLELSTAILDSQSTEDIAYSDENRYTSMLLLQAINDTLSKACIESP